MIRSAVTELNRFIEFLTIQQVQQPDFTAVIFWSRIQDSCTSSEIQERRFRTCMGHHFVRAETLVSVLTVREVSVDSVNPIIENTQERRFNEETRTGEKPRSDSTISFTSRKKSTPVTEFRQNFFYPP
ncbi:hypothetical protein M569_10507 [Genlisea aurea]|uniref:Uncharacterized protein n=1 Tax=Genlisea aurea TaxID=192259 RepID=S8DWF3_9LAMI|nr:hypothetical protein M569_10507 [Genlisea aurea]